MFPVLNKYVASQLKSSNYISLDQLEKESAGEPRKPPARHEPVLTKSSAEHSLSTADQSKAKGQAESLKRNLLSKKGSLLKKFVNS